jgi:hypothetical protein
MRLRCVCTPSEHRPDPGGRFKPCLSYCVFSGAGLAAGHWFESNPVHALGAGFRRSRSFLFDHLHTFCIQPKMKKKNKTEFTTPEIIEVSHTIRRLTYLSAPHFDITEPKSVNEYYYWSVVLEILIHLNDLLLKLDSIGKRIDSTDYTDFKVQPGRKINDINDLINYYRNAGCHNDSDRRRNDQGYLNAAISYGAYDFRDEVSILMGESKLYARRHLVKIYHQVFSIYQSINGFNTNGVFNEALESFNFREPQRLDELKDRIPGSDGYISNEDDEWIKFDFNK